MPEPPINIKQLLPVLRKSIDNIGCPEERCERMRRFAGNSSFCQAYALEVLTSTSTYRQLIIFMFLFVIISYQARFCLQISYPAILFTMLVGFLNHGNFIVDILLSETSKAFTLSGSLPGASIHIVLLSTQRYKIATRQTIC